MVGYARYLIRKYNMNCNAMNTTWMELQNEQYEVGQNGALIRELCYMRDTNDNTILAASEIKMMIDELCTE